MAKVTVWTRQHENVWKVLQESGRYIARKEYIEMENQEDTGIVLRAYDWLASHGPNLSGKPADVQYPVWISLTQESKMPPEQGNVILELSIEEADITRINITKWSMILNYSYIPLSEADAKQHRALLEMYGTNDVKAVMTSFYPEIKREITDSWSRLFDDSVVVGNDLVYGTVWELRKEWVREVTCAEQG